MAIMKNFGVNFFYFFAIILDSDSSVVASHVCCFKFYKRRNSIESVLCFPVWYIYIMPHFRKFNVFLPRLVFLKLYMGTDIFCKRSQVSVQY